MLLISALWYFPTELKLWVSSLSRCQNIIMYKFGVSPTNIRILAFLAPVFLPQHILRIELRSVGQYSSTTRTHTHTHLLTLPPGQGAFFSAVKSVSLQWKFGHVWTAGCSTSAALGLCLLLAAQPGSSSSVHFQRSWNSTGNFT